MLEKSERTLATTIHGRYLVSAPERPGPAPILVGFHGYGEDAETQLERIRSIPGSADWLCVSIQALHRFYQRSANRVVASWMTRQDRDDAIADNIAYVSRCLHAVTAEFEAAAQVVFAGFSQGVATAFRAAVNSPGGSGIVIAVGGDVPPELGDEDLNRLATVLLVRGKLDGWYTRQKFQEDSQRLRRCCPNVEAVEVNGGHEWSSEVAEAASQFLDSQFSASQEDRS